MSEVFDISTVSDPYARLRVGASSRETPKKPPETAVRATDLQRELDRATLNLSSARRTLRTYRTGVRSLATGAAVGGLMAVSGIATAIGSTAMGLNATVTVLWLVLFGLPIILGSIVGLYVWHNMHRIKYEWRKRTDYSSTYVVDSKSYVDPQHNVEVAELAYGRALARLAEHKDE